MNRRTPILARLRKHRFGLGRAALAVFAVASVAAGAAPCFAMAVAGPADPVADHAAQHGTDRSVQHGADHSVADDTQAGHVAHQHTRASATTEAGTASPASHHNTPHHCPHCPLAASMAGHESSNSHAFCSAVDATSDQVQPSASPAVLKHALLLATLEIPHALPLRLPDAVITRTRAPRYAAVAINLRHCVFLI